ncbi:MAG: universal stress protein [Hyphomonas sp.]|jgi:nucleotide-binding universal stress UspA family protein|nr:universal stress protein [Hyphomonas sp.]MDP3460192.1 universal stress protein [Hyphomonas sp.]
MSIVAVLQGTSETDTLTTQSALALARKLNLPLTGLCTLPDPQSALMVVSTPESAGMSAAAVKSLMDMQKDMLAAAEGAFRNVVNAGAGAVESTFLHQVGTAERAAASAATLAEAIVFPRSASKSGEPLSIAFEHVMMDARLPVVLAGAKPFQPGPVIIGWDGSNGASRAVRFHVPLITAMGDVIIAQNRKDAERDGARPGLASGLLEDWLKRRGVTARSESLEGEVAGALLALATGAGATMIVAGAYGHSRLGERLFGGTSRRLLEATESPALALAR